MFDHSGNAAFEQLRQLNCRHLGVEAAFSSTACNMNMRVQKSRGQFLSMSIYHLAKGNLPINVVLNGFNFV